MKVVVFDLDDTLVQWKPAVREAAARVAAGAARPIAAATVAGAVRRAWEERAAAFWTGHIGEAEVAEVAAAALASALGVSREEGAAIYAAFLNHLDGLIIPHDDTAALPALRAEYRLGVATNGHGVVQREKLRRGGLAHLFDFVIVSADVGVAKPDPAFYDAVRRTAGVPVGEITVVGDHIGRDLLPARAIGMAAIWIHRDDTPPEVPWDGPAITSLFQLESVLAEGT